MRSKKKILIVVGTRPNFIKVTQFKKVASDKYKNLELKIVHTGQHYDHKMANVFFDQFNLIPDYFLNIGKGSPIEQMAKIMQGLEHLIDNKYSPDCMLVPGDVNSTLAAALVANKKGIKLGHLESGLRSFDREMPEEINRILTDLITDFYFITEQSGEENLSKEEQQGTQVLVGNTMIDTLVAFKKEIEKSTIIEELGISDEYVLMTIHRPSNVDSKEGLLKLIDLLQQLSEDVSIVFPIHPRTENMLKEYGLEEELRNLKKVVCTNAMGYFDFQKLVTNSKLVLTDSGGIQEETTFLKIPCLTLRANTERPITIDKGTNMLIPFDVNVIMKHVQLIFKGDYKTGETPLLWDGKATHRILEFLNEKIG